MPLTLLVSSFGPWEIFLRSPGLVHTASFASFKIMAVFDDISGCSQ